MPKKQYDVEQVLEDKAKFIAELRKRDAAVAKKKADAAAAKKKKVSWVETLKMGVTGQLAKRRHSKAGKKYLGRKK